MDKILELDADKVCLVTDTFSKAELFVQSDNRLGYIKLNAPGLYNFTLPQPGCPHDGSTGNVQDNAGDKLIDKWTGGEATDEINLIRAQEEKQFGLLQRDEATGELYMLLPLELDVLLQPEQQQLHDLLAAESQVDDEVEDKVEDEDEDGDDNDSEHEDSSQTTLTDMPKLDDEQQRELCRFVLPQMSLNFQLTLQIGNLSDDDD